MHPFRKILITGGVVLSTLTILSSAFAESNAAQARELAAIKTQLSEAWAPPAVEKSAEASFGIIH